MSVQETVHIVDDDPAIRVALTASLESRNLSVKSYESAELFLESYEDTSIGCLVLDIRMPGISGLELQEILTEKKYYIPIIFITGHGDVPMSVKALKCGAIDFLEKPYRPEILHERIEQALLSSKKFKKRADEINNYKERYNCLSPREKQIMAMLVDKHENISNKKIAKALNISPRTVEDHRAKIMLKMKVKSLYELVNLSNTQIQS